MLVEQLGQDLPSFLWVTRDSSAQRKQTSTDPSHGTELNPLNSSTNCSTSAYFMSSCTNDNALNKYSLHKQSLDLS